MRSLFSGLGANTYFTLFQERDKDLYYTFKNNIVGGPSIIFNRYQEKDKTFIRGGKPCKRVWGADANALYLWALAQDMPCGYYVRRKAESNFKKEDYFNKASVEWLDYVAHRDGLDIQHAHNVGEKRIGRYVVDGFDTTNKTVYEFNGCYFHGHDCEMNTNDFNERVGVPMSVLFERTIERKHYLEDRGFTVVDIWECEYKQMRKTDKDLKLFRQNYIQGLDVRTTMTENEVLSKITEGEIFGVVECDIHVPEDKKDKFSEMCPIFKNVDIPFEAIDEHMQNFVEQNRLSKKPRRGLIGSMFGNKILLTTPLLRWYVKHGLKVTKVYEVIEYTPKNCFTGFADEVSNARREGDRDPSTAIIAETMKLHGNSGYGGTLTNKEKHLDVRYYNEANIARAVNDSHFRKLDIIDENFYEVSKTKKSISMNLPVQIGFFVYQYAKLRMLEFYYDFMDKFIDRSDFEYCEMDTDSAYVALSGESVDDLIKPELRAEYERVKFAWFPRDYNAEVSAFDKRTPGLFKTEFKGDGIIGLCSKMYFCFNESEAKFSCKGVNKYTNAINKDTYLRVLRTKATGAATNRGFRVRGSSVFTYTQVKNAFAYFYGKRKVLDDGVSTSYLDI